MKTNKIKLELLSDAEWHHTESYFEAFAQSKSNESLTVIWEVDIDFEPGDWIDWTDFTVVDWSKQDSVVGTNENYEIKNQGPFGGMKRK